MSEKIKKLNDFQHARLRTEMYLSSRDPITQTILEYENGKPVAREATWVPALFTSFREVLDNALDEVITHGHGNTIKVEFDPKELRVVIDDNGRGIPIGFDKEHHQHEATLALTETKAGRNFEDRGASRGLNGVGASIVNFCSEYFTVDIRRDKKHFNQRFSEGEAELNIESPIIFPYTGKDTGTRIEFKLSKKVFTHHALPESFIYSRVYEIALIYAEKLKVYYNGSLIKVPKKNALDLLFDNKIFISIEDTGFKSDYYIVPQFFSDGREHQHSLVNAIPTYNGGTHIDSFRNGFYSGLLGAMERESKKRKLVPNKSDISDGVLIFNVTEMDEPTFDSQSKSRLLNKNVNSAIKKALDDPEFFKNVMKKNPAWIESIYERCAERTLKKDDDEAKKKAKANKKEKVEDLEDACGAIRSNCMLFLAEGKSAVSGMIEARDPNIHGGLPLRGKVLNVHGRPAKEIYENEALSKIMNAIGLSVGERANRHMLRYGKVYITTDADEDGKNIAALLINFFYSQWPELFDPDKPAFVYLFDTPLIIAVKGKNRKYWYNDNYSTFDPEQHKGWEITRAKGLAALKRDDWKWVLANPKAIPITDDGKLKASLNLLFNNALADQRKEWIGL